MVAEDRADRLALQVRALIVTNMYPTPQRPALGSFVRDQVQALQRLDGVELELFQFAPGGISGYVGAGAGLRRRFRRERFDVVHAHFGLTAWSSLGARAALHAVTLHGTDLSHPRSRALTLAALPLLDLVATVSEPLAELIPARLKRRGVATLPCGIELSRFRPMPREQARAELGLDPDQPYLLFPADPARPEKRYGLAQAVAVGRAELLTLGNVAPEQVPLWVNACNAVLVPSEREGYGLAVLEALACDVPVLATPVGIAPEALRGIDGTLCEPFSVERWGEVVDRHLGDLGVRVSGRERAEQYSTDRMARRVLEAWQAALIRKR